MPLCITAGGNASPRSETCTKLLETKLEIPSNRKWCIQCLQTPIKPDAKNLQNWCLFYLLSGDFVEMTNKYFLEKLRRSTLQTRSEKKSWPM